MYFRNLVLIFLLLFAIPALGCTLSTSISSPPISTYTTAQTVTITASVSDTFTITKVEFYDGDVLKGMDTTSPYTLNWTFTSVDNGVHNWTVRAYDSNFNVTNSDSVRLTVDIVSAGGGSLTWDSIISGSVSSSFIAPNAITSDSTGNIIVAGSFQGTLDFGGGTLLTSAGSDDIFLAKYTPAGSLIWAKRLGSSGSDAGWGVAINSVGEILVTGAFQGTVDFGGGGLTSAAGNDIFVAKYATANGAFIWANRYGSTLADLGYSIKSDSSNNVLVTGYFNGTVNFGTGPIVSGGAADIFLLKLTNTGTTVWAKGIGGTQADIGRSVTADSQGNVVLTGYYKGSVDFGGGLLTSAGGNDAFLAKYAAGNGAYMWAQRYGGTLDDRSNSVAIGTGDNIVITGTFTDLIDFGGGNLPNTGGGGDMFLTKFSSNGVLAWAKGFGTGLANYGEVSNAVGIDANSDSIAIAGGIIGNVDFGGGVLTGTGTYDAFLAKFNSAGTHQWSKRFPGSYDDFVLGITMPTGGPTIFGYFPGTIDLGGGTITNSGGAFSYDGFLAQFTP